MNPIRCPYCGAASMEAAARDDGSFLCTGCGRAVEPPPRRTDLRDDRRWASGPTEESASRWSSVPPLGDEESSSSFSASQSSILPRTELEERDEAGPAGGSRADARQAASSRSPLVWLLLTAVLFLAAMIGAVIVARRVKPWWDARREKAQRATVEYWWPPLENGPEHARQEAARAIVDLGSAAVVKTLDHFSSVGDQLFLNRGAIVALAAVGPDAVAGLSEGLVSPKTNVRAAAAEVLRQMGRAGRSARDALVRALDDDNVWVRGSAIDALGSLGPDGAPAANRLAELAESRSSGKQLDAIDALAHIGPAARDALPALEAIAVAGADPIMRARAARAMQQIDVERLAGKARREAARPLKELLQAVLGEDEPAALVAAKKLGDMGLAAAPAAAGLAVMLHRDEPARRAAAATALGKIGMGASDFVPTLETAAGDDDPAVRAAAAKALEGINGKPK